MKVKLLSFWIGPRPKWWSLFVERMGRFRDVQWTCVPPVSKGQAEWMNAVGAARLGTPCAKGPFQAMCDFRPAYAEMFPEELADCDWWGWLDLDVLVGDLDRWFAELLTDEWDVVSFKPRYLSGCLTLLRNRPEVNTAFRRGPYKQVLADKAYYCWDESGNDRGGCGTFLDVLLGAGLKVSLREDLYVYDAPTEPNPVRLEGGDVVEVGTGRRVPFCHFMTDVWPVKADGSPRDAT